MTLIAHISLWWSVNGAFIGVICFALLIVLCTNTWWLDKWLDKK